MRRLLSRLGAVSVSSRLTDGQHGATELFVQYLGHGQVNCGAAADDAFETGQGADGGTAEEIAGRQQAEQDDQRAEHELQGFGPFQGAEEHKQREDAPHQQVPTHGKLIGGITQPQLRQQDQEDQADPEETVGGEGGQAEGVTLFEFQDAGDDLRQAAVSQTHGQDHGADRHEAGVVDVEQHCGHAKAHQAERGWIGQFFVHVIFS